MDPIPLQLDLPGIPSAPTPSDMPRYPHVWLENLREVDLPEEGEIRFRYSRRRKTEVETKNDETVSYELCLKAITDICDCKGKEDDGMNEPDEMPNDGDAESALERIMKELGDEVMEDESEDDNPAKY